VVARILNEWALAKRDSPDATGSYAWFLLAFMIHGNPNAKKHSARNEPIIPVCFKVVSFR
jgi:hypothetical protein